jgi:hypothetical protein
LDWVTSRRNDPSKEGNEVFPNTVCIVTLLDRLLHLADVTAMEGDSYRQRESEQETTARRRRKKWLLRRVVAPGLNPALHVSAVLTLYVDLPDAPLRASALDQWRCSLGRDAA